MIQISCGPVSKSTNKISGVWLLISLISAAASISGSYTTLPDNRSPGCIRLHQVSNCSTSVLLFPIIYTLWSFFWRFSNIMPKLLQLTTIPPASSTSTWCALSSASSPGRIKSACSITSRYDSSPIALSNSSVDANNITSNLSSERYSFIFWTKTSFVIISMSISSTFTEACIVSLYHPCYWFASAVPRIISISYPWSTIPTVTCGFLKYFFKSSPWPSSLTIIFVCVKVSLV